MQFRDNKLRFIFLSIDLIVLNVVILFLGWIRFDIVLRNYHESSFYLLISNLSLLLAYVFFVKNNIYLRDTFVKRIKIITVKTLNLTLILGTLMLFFLNRKYSPTFLLECILLFYLSELLLFRIFYFVLNYRRKKGNHTNRVLIVGDDEKALYLREIITTNPLLGYNFVGFVSENPEMNGFVGFPGQLAQLIKKHQANMIFISTAMLSNQEHQREYIELCSSMCARLRFVTNKSYGLNAFGRDETVGNLILINPMEFPLANWANRLVKRLADIIISAIAILLVFSWLFPIIAILIKISSKGPVFFIQKRTGLNRKTFWCIKFRSMKMNMQSNRIQAIKNDKRITIVGQFIRKTNLDELPQFFNVFLGQMSVVGPRPHMLRHTGQYSQLIDQYLFRHSVKPGITGWAQVNGFRGETDELWKMQKRVEYDMDYIENWNFWWDLEIIWKTVFFAEAYGSVEYKQQLAN